MKLRLQYLLFSCFFLLCFGDNLNAQKKVQYLQYEDLKPFHFGFLVGLHTQDLIFSHTGHADTDGRKWYGSIPSYTPGFTVGVIGDLRLADFLSLRLLPGIHFGSKEVSLISDATDAIAIKSPIRSNYIMLPLNLRYRGSRSGNYRPYLMGGLSAGLDMGRDKNVPLLLETINTYLEFGAGCDIYLPYFRLVPELKFCLGLGDILVHDRNDQGSDVYEKYTSAFEKITSRLVVLSLQIE